MLLFVSGILGVITFISISTFAQSHHFNPDGICLDSNQAKKNRALIVAIDSNDLASVKEALEVGADANCPYASVDKKSGRNFIKYLYDVPLYHAIKPGVSPVILKVLLDAGAIVNSDLPKAQANFVEDRYFGFFVGLSGGDSEQSKAKAYVPPPETTAAMPPPEAVLSPKEVQMAITDPAADDAWSRLSAEAPLTSTVIGGEHLRSVLKYVTDVSAWQTRAQAVRQAILDGAGLSPLPPKTPLYSKITLVNTHSHYTVNNVYFEATPGFYVTGNLFLPANQKGPAPAILLPHGHFGPWDGYARTLPENQILATQLAQMGAIVFTYDMIGWGDSQQLNHPDSYGFLGFGDQSHFDDGTKNNLLELELWDSIRAVDFLQSLKDQAGNSLVDSNRIGVTGASGGATQSLYLAAVDPRISAAALVVMVTAGFTGDDHCEDGMPVHTVKGQKKTNNTEIAATFAPKPLLIISDGHDWTQWFNRDEYPYIKKVYGFFNADNYGLNFNFPNEVHDYGPNKRARAYQFFSAAFGLPYMAQAPNSLVPTDGNVEGVFLEDREALKVFNESNPRPSGLMNHLEIQ